MSYLKILSKYGNLNPTALNMDSLFENIVLNNKMPVSPSGEEVYLSVNHACQIIGKTFVDVVTHTGNLFFFYSPYIVVYIFLVFSLLYNNRGISC